MLSVGIKMVGGNVSLLLGVVDECFSDSHTSVLPRSRGTTTFHCSLQTAYTQVFNAPRSPGPSRVTS